MQKLPRKNKQWAKEAWSALLLAWKIAEAEHGELNQTARETLYKYGPIFCARNRGITKKEEIREMAAFAIRDRFEDFKADPDSVHHYGINFLLAYLDSHVYLNLLTSGRVEAIMEFLVENHDLQV